MSQTGRKNRETSNYEQAADSLRAYLESALGALADGAPRGVVRVFVISARSILDEAEHGVPRLGHKAKDDTVCAYIPDVVPERE